MDNKWEMLESSNEDREKIWTKNRTFAGDVWYRFHRKPTAIAGFIIILFLLFFAIAGPMFTKYSYSTQNLEVVNIPPYMKVFETPDNSGYLYITQALKVLQVDKDGKLGVQLKKVREESDRSMTIYDCNGTEIGLGRNLMLSPIRRRRQSIRLLKSGTNPMCLARITWDGIS